MNAAPRGLCRREILGGAAALAVLGLASGCGGKPGTSATARPSPVTIPAANLPEGGRLTVMLGNNPVEVHRGPDGVTARMLRCTHTGCFVRWRAAERDYLCACHEGRFDGAGKVLAGPPTLPLRSVPVLLSEGDIVVGA